MEPLFDTDEYFGVPAYIRTKMVTQAIVDRYALRVQRGICLAFAEVPSSTGGIWINRVDVWVQFMFDCHRFRRVAYEVKVSRSDFLSELRNPDKRQFALSISNEYYFATPPGLVRLDELPEEAGLVEVKANGSLVTKRKAPWRDNPPPEWHFVAALARKASNAPVVTEEQVGNLPEGEEQLA